MALLLASQNISLVDVSEVVPTAATHIDSIPVDPAAIS